MRVVLGRWSRGPRQAWVAAALIGSFVSAGYAQTPAPNVPRESPDFRVQVWGQAMVDFNTRVSSYFDLRSKLEQGLPAPTSTNDPAEIRSTERALARRIRAARKGARQGAIFTPAISAEFRKTLLPELGADTRTVILMDDNPGSFSHAINGTYPKTRPLSTVPFNILAALPRLPEDIEYRFLGRHLILYDTRANVILDRIPCVVPGRSHVGCHR